MTANMVEVFEKLEVQISDLYKEMSALSKKSPNEKINKFKLGFVNQLLSVSNGLLKENFKPLDNFDLFDEDDVPSNSDVVMVISQYISCLQKFKYDNVKQQKGGVWYWQVNDDDPIRTSRPEMKFTF